MLESNIRDKDTPRTEFLMELRVTMSYCGIRTSGSVRAGNIVFKSKNGKNDILHPKISVKLVKQTDFYKWYLGASGRTSKNIAAA